MTRISPPPPDARLARKGQGKEAKLSYAGHVLLDNRHGLVANVCVTPATGTAEREAAWLLPGAQPHGGTVAGDKAFDLLHNFFLWSVPPGRTRAGAGVAFQYSSDGGSIFG